MAQEYLDTRIILRNDSNENWSTHKDQILLKGEAGVEFVNGKVKIKIGDGTTTWENLKYFGGDEAKNFQVNSLDEITNTELAVGDTAIVKTLIYEDANNANNNKYSYTGYVYNGTDWAAMDGNYNAENVYFDEDLTTTYQMGNYSLTNGSATIPSAGKNLKQIWDAIYLKEDKDVSVSNPSISLSAANSGKTYEVGSTFTRPTATVKIEGIGSYEYGSKDVNGASYSSKTATNVTFSKLKVGFGENIDTTTAYSEIKDGGYVTNQTHTYTATETDIPNNYVEEGTRTFKFCAEGHYSASDRYPVTNLGNYLTAGSISNGVFKATAVNESATNADGDIIAKGNISASAADGIEKTASWTVTGYREGFYFGTSTTEVAPTAVTSAIIRGLATKTGANYAAGKRTVTIPVGAKTVIIACPANKTGVTDVLNTTVNANMNESFGVGKTPTKVNVGGADATAESVGSYGREYNVWLFTPPEAYGSSADLSITLG